MTKNLKSLESVFSSILCFFVFLYQMGSLQAEEDYQFIGESSDDSISRLFIRDSEVLLNHRQFQFSLGFDYNSDESLRSFRKNRDRSLSIPLVISYGLANDLEVNATFPLEYKSYEIVGPTDVNKKKRSGMGDLSFGMSYKLKSEAISSPAITTSLGLTVPTGKDNISVDDLSFGSDYWTASSNLQVSKSIDPAVIFANIGYQYVVEDQKSNFTIQPGSSITYSFGTGLSINDALSFSGRIVGSYQKETKQNGQKVSGSSSEPISFITGMGYRINRDLRLESNISLGISDDAQDVGISGSYIWNVR